ncbi:MAG: filamentous hemagglutinin N-terminal domain-containing protein [Verrucomicrobiales bacterium]|nr:filamentous hemagglutinin N-terminal domain-containing protein [Verrucomicrobiales bacterium]
MKRRLVAGLTLLCVLPGFFFCSTSTDPHLPESIAPSKSNLSIINISNEMMEAMIADGTYSNFVEAPNSNIIFRVNSGGPTRVSGKLASQGTLHIINPAGIVMGADAKLMNRSFDFHSTF